LRHILDFKALARQRQEHQTIQAAKCVTIKDTTVATPTGIYHPTSNKSFELNFMNSANVAAAVSSIATQPVATGRVQRCTTMTYIYLR
jgi:hypothetical protein